MKSETGTPVGDGHVARSGEFLTGTGDCVGVSVKNVLSNGRVRVYAIVNRDGNYHRNFTFGDSLGNFLATAPDPSAFDVTLSIPNEIDTPGDLDRTIVRVNGQTAISRYRHLMQSPE